MFGVELVYTCLRLEDVTQVVVIAHYHLPGRSIHIGTSCFHSLLMVVCYRSVSESETSAPSKASSLATRTGGFTRITFMWAVYFFLISSELRILVQERPVNLEIVDESLEVGVVHCFPRRLIIAICCLHFLHDFRLLYMKPFK
jgi:hypothetical protein